MRKRRGEDVVYEMKRGVEEEEGELGRRRVGEEEEYYGRGEGWRGQNMQGGR